MKAILIAAIVGLALAGAVAPTASAEYVDVPDIPPEVPECWYYYYDWESPVGTIRMPDRIECTMQ